MSKLIIKNLHVSAEGKEILRGINAEFETGKVYAIIGPNGNGKSTLLSTIMGDPNFVVTKGEIIFNNENLLELEVHERAKLGIFLGMQYPSEISGIANLDLIKTAREKIYGEKLSTVSVYKDVLKLSRELRIDESMMEREVNVGFSGGEKKKNELLHMFSLKPKIALLDEVDSGLDVDSIEAISNRIKESKSKDSAFVIVSHYKKLYQKIKPDVVYVIKDGKIIQKDNYNMLMNILDKGFDNV